MRDAAGEGVEDSGEFRFLSCVFFYCAISLALGVVFFSIVRFHWFQANLESCATLKEVTKRFACQLFATSPFKFHVTLVSA